MKRVLYVLITFCILLPFGSCSRQMYAVYQFDNGDDYFEEGMRRIVDKNGKIGFADEAGRVVIKPRFAFVFPFSGGKAKATLDGHSESDGEHSWWVSDYWFFIDHDGNIIKP